VDACGEFEECVLNKREQLGWALMTALNQLSVRYLAFRQYGDAIHCARQMVQREPWDEIARQHLMRALALAAHRGDTLRQYADCRRTLLAELHAEHGA